MQSAIVDPLGPSVYLSWVIHLLTLLFWLPGASAEAPKRPIKLALGEFHSCALFEDGTAKCWGSNSSGELGVGDTISRGGTPESMGDNLPYVDVGGARILDLQANGSFTCALLQGGTIKCWGYNGYGNLGQGDTRSRGGSPQSIGKNLRPVSLAGKVTRFAMGANHVCAILENGSLKCWGSNYRGALGIENTRNRGPGILDMGLFLPAVQLGIARKAVHIAGGYYHTCAVLDDSSVKCWGDGADGQLGQGNLNAVGMGPNQMGDFLKPIDLGTSLKPIQVFAGTMHSCVLFEDHSIKCWGNNEDGTTGTGSSSITGDRPTTMGSALPFVELEPGLPIGQMSCARRHCCTLYPAVGLMKCWGINEDGQLGLGDAINRGNVPDQMGGNLPFIDLGTFKVATYVATGRNTTCVILADGGVKCWGLNDSGQLGVGDLRSRGVLSSDMGDQLPRVSLF